MMLKVSLLSEVLAFPRSRKIPRFTSCFEYLCLYDPPFHHPSIISHFSKLLQRDQIFHYQNKPFYISKLVYRVYFSYSIMVDKMLIQKTDECQLVWYVSQFQVAYCVVLHWHLKSLFLLLTIPQLIW